MPMQNMHDLKDKVDLNLGILSACETAIFMKSPEKAEEHPGFVFNDPYDPQKNYIPIAAYTAHWQDRKAGEK